MSAPRYKIVVFRAHKGGWGARLLSGRNGRELWRQSEAVRSKQHCLRIILEVFQGRLSGAIEVEVLP